MKPLPEIDLKKCYPGIEKSKSYEGYNLKELFKKIEKEKNPVNFRNQLMVIVQLYFDGVLTNKMEGLLKTGKREEVRQKEILERLCLAGKESVGSFYRGEGIKFKAIKEIFIPYAKNIIKENPIKASKFRHLVWRWKDMQVFGRVLRNLLDKKSISIDTLVCVASGGFEPSFLMMDILKKDCLIPLRYSFKRSDNKVKTTGKQSTYTSKIKNKKVLVVDDWVASGKSLNIVFDYIAKKRPEEIYGTAVIGSPLDLYIPPQMGIINSMLPFFCKMDYSKNLLSSSLIFSELERRIR
jgi:adenine/guanine phosphoribosyltransferase-like PRPP-binding protein